MRSTTTTRRSGVTLLETLVAIFVMGIGLLALLTLFPLGALRMAKAIQDDSCSQLGANARAIAVMKGIPWDGNVTATYANPGGALGALPVHPDYPSYPVFVDPIGFYASVGLPGQGNLGGGISLVGRVAPSFLAPPPALDTVQWFTRQDDIVFENALPGAGNGPPGLPQLLLPPPPANFTRDTRFSYALMCQRARSIDTMVADISVVVYNKRSVTPTAGGVSLPETVYPAIGPGGVNGFNLATNTVTIDYTNNVPPSVNVGDWILDNTPIQTPNGTGWAHGAFYRIVGLNDLGNNQLEMEVETPLRGFATSQNGLVVVLDGVAEVYTLGTVRLP